MAQADFETTAGYLPNGSILWFKKSYRLFTLSSFYKETSKISFGTYFNTNFNQISKFSGFYIDKTWISFIDWILVMYQFVIVARLKKICISQKYDFE